jgi:hypothetical protein
MKVISKGSAALAGGAVASGALVASGAFVASTTAAGAWVGLGAADPAHPARAEKSSVAHSRMASSFFIQFSSLIISERAFAKKYLIAFLRQRLSLGFLLRYCLAILCRLNHSERALRNYNSKPERNMSDDFLRRK